jgi:hypothetical protein
MSEVQCQLERLKNLFLHLKSLIFKLPNCISEGTKDGSIAKYFGDYDIDADEGPYFSVNRA